MSARILQPVRGTHDILGDEFRKHAHISATAHHVASLFCYEPIATPIFEYTPVFKRTLGETSDIVGKEMYTFQDRGGDEITLRPESTAAVTRAFISEGLTQNLPQKLICSGPMFRYERPQKGRLRQFHQVAVECFAQADPYLDVEVIVLAAQILTQLGVIQDVTLQLNTLGTPSERLAYRSALVAYLSAYQQDLSEASKVRLEKNPLRILDSKDQGDQKIIQDAPLLKDYLETSSRDYFEKVCEILQDLHIRFVLNPRLVRGLDYYNHTTFEFVTDKLGAQGTLVAGGRYDGLVAQMGGPNIGGIGWGLGIERVALMLENAPPSARPIAIIPIGEEVKRQTFKLAVSLRKEGLPVHLGFSGNVGKRLKQADKHKARFAILLGEDELAKEGATVRDLDTGLQQTIALDQLITYFSTYYR